MLVLGVDLGLCAEVYADSIAQDCFTVEHLSEIDGVRDAVEADDNASEGFEWREGVNRCVLVDCGSDALEARGLEDLGGVEVGD